MTANSGSLVWTLVKFAALHLLFSMVSAVLFIALIFQGISNAAMFVVVIVFGFFSSVVAAGIAGQSYLPSDRPLLTNKDVALLVGCSLVISWLVHLAFVIANLLYLGTDLLDVVALIIRNNPLDAVLFVKIAIPLLLNGTAFWFGYAWLARRLREFSRAKAARPGS
ncbi:MAG: hypothetical protein RIC14_15935 [Filomicrobium sp.]